MNNRRPKIIGSRAFIPLSQGLVTVIDCDDLKLVEGYVWHVFIDKTNAYARRTDRLAGGVRKTIQLHRIIARCPDDRVVDHIDGNGLNNVRSNLRICDPINNAQNLKDYKNNSTGFRGVQHYGNGRFRAQIRHQKKLIHLGVFDCAEEASAAYESAKAKLHGEFVRHQSMPLGELFR